jgi:hypothetical protein
VSARLLVLAAVAAALATSGACSQAASVAPGGAPDAAPDFESHGRLAPPAPPDALQVHFLGVAGYLLRYGDQAVLTAPLFTRPSMLDVTLGSIASDRTLVQQDLPPGTLGSLRAIVTGHAHYDHLLDTPELLLEAPAATLYANQSAAHILAALAPDPSPACAGTPLPAQTIARSRVVALDDPAASYVDYRPCPADRPDGAPLAGAWMRVPGSRVRLYAICSAHPDQIGPYHFGPGSVDVDQCTLPTVANDWREGRTLGLLIDFLDGCDRPIYRVYYQDAPTTVPIGLPPADVLADKRIDLALLNVGNYDKVVDAPSATLAALEPRFALGGHWEDFFQPASNPPQPLPLQDTPGWVTKAQAALPAASPSINDPMWLAGGIPATERAILPMPGDAFTIDAPAGTWSCGGS